MNIHPPVKYNCCTNTDRLNPFALALKLVRVIRHINVGAKRAHKREGKERKVMAQSAHWRRLFRLARYLALLPWRVQN